MHEGEESEDWLGQQLNATVERESVRGQRED